MECNNCELRQRQYYCAVSYVISAIKLHHFSSDRNEHVARAFHAFKSIESSRLQIRADLAKVNRSLEQLVVGRLAKRDRLRTLREALGQRRRTLNTARLLPPQSQALAKESQELSVLSQTIARARSGLVQELLEVFHVVEVGGRPAVGGRPGAKGEWTIGGLILPVPGDVRRYPPDHINAVITHTIHFLGLLTFYLGIKLPFEISWSCRKLGVGVPWIRAGRGSESWAKWTAKHPMHLTSKPSSTPSSPTSSPSCTSASLADSEAPEQVPAHTQNQSFTTGFAMLLYNVCYLAHTQGVEIPLSQAGDCIGGELGRRSHSTTPLLLPPTPPSFMLDFAQVLQTTAASPARAARIRPGRSAQEAGIGRTRSERIVEEDGWDVVELGEEEGFG
ncbi:UV radiation resistance protein and autophagy-related subunit 14-domain-containing protein [Suillus bovinus]|uniref:UV radiation resistance protein and autophagy-related subunit 14-domain-containing protein n=1 Tax=Suillus bovinus TaxID=48563 RepID=UPI001B87C608|nr:UV radiation resistance protein and autophagy-related subunit 14-domain-containing protein [Suillus bovinus]KAG2139134.1 UV radiation resistance protein and autophagy-related subunit 14-domain-containing protein [Suillus bovinus]